ncbi:MAG TPA: peptidylprolyl isomerase [Sunxiuqinia sp.]|nr:peptidylprolyl isomerase [Sunxiuqinia sp.]
MYRFLVLFVLTFAVTLGYGQKNKEVIMTIDGHPIYKEEFVRLYKKNNEQAMDKADKKTPKEYLELFENFKLKVIEAERLKYDTVPSFINELKKYRADLAAPYLTAAQYTDEMVKREYGRMKSEVDASHILIRLKSDASPEDTLNAWNRTMDIRKQIMNGADFGEMAVKYSEDPSAKQNKGNLGYFSAFQMVYPFENAAYNTAVGQVSMPIRTRFGYHLIKVIDKRPAKGQIKVAHIMKRVASNASEETIKRQKAAIDSLDQLLVNGADFSKLARSNSDDRRSAVKGGELPWFSSSNMMPQFAAPAFALKHDGELSPVIRTPYGFHIIKRIEYRPLGSFNDMKEFLADKIRKSPNMSHQSKEIFINKLKKEYHFTQNSVTYDRLMSTIKQNYTKGGINKLTLSNGDDVLFSFADQKITNQQFVDFLKKATSTSRQPSMLPPLPNKYSQFVEDTMTKYEDEHLSEKYPDFKYLLKEYHDGILLFNISEDKVWNAASNDSTGLEEFYKHHKGKYKWGPRFKGFIIKCGNQAQKDFINGIFVADPEIMLNELKDQVNQKFPNNQIGVTYGYYEEGKDPLVDYLVWNTAKPADYQDGLDFVHGSKVSPEPKSLTDARGLYLSDYQNYLEKEWLKELHKRYKVKVNRKVLKSIQPVK